MTDRRSRITRIEGGTIIAFDGREHRHLEGGCLVFEGDTIVFVGRRHTDRVDEIIDATGKIVMPGMISTHAHVSAQEGTRLLLDGGRRDHFSSTFIEYIAPRKGGPAFLRDWDQEASVRFGMASLVRHGVTTVIPFSPGGKDNGKLMVDLAGEMGLRIYFAPTSTGGAYHYDRSGRLRHDMDFEGGLDQLRRAGEHIEAHNGAHDGRVRGIVVLDEFYLSTPALRKAARDLADKLGVGLTLHFAERLNEFHETVQETGKTPVGVLADEGILGPDVVLAHCMFVNGHSWTAYPFGDDLETLGRLGCTVAHSPGVWARLGIGLESFQRYLDSGITMAIGTDAYPMDPFTEMRMAALVCKLKEQNHEAGRAVDVFNAATLGGAKALGRDDLGRLAPGAKADIVIVDVDNLQVGPIYDPIQALVHLVTPQMVDRVIVDGRTLVCGKTLRVCDEAEVLAAARATSREAWDGYVEFDWGGRPIERVFPRSLRPWQD